MFNDAVSIYMQASNGQYTVQVSNDKSWSSPIEFVLSNVLQSAGMQRLWVTNSKTGSFVLDFVNSIYKWYLAVDNSGSPGPFVQALTLSSLPCFVWIKAVSLGTQETSAYDTSCSLRATVGTEVDYFDTLRILQITGQTKFDAIRKTYAGGQTAAFDSKRILCEGGEAIFDIDRLLYADGQLPFDAVRKMYAPNQTASFDAERYLTVPKQNYFFFQ